mmetsp:Transcript_36303/g.104623  ORF Transcript_36303/g.104623 Transcript_36303/m.104623 type:complete len:218 (-) Transcript_36303:317-970(-)
MLYLSGYIVRRLRRAVLLCMLLVGAFIPAEQVCEQIVLHVLRGGNCSPWRGVAPNTDLFRGQRLLARSPGQLAMLRRLMTREYCWQSLRVVGALYLRGGCEVLRLVIPKIALLIFACGGDRVTLGDGGFLRLLARLCFFYRLSRGIRRTLLLCKPFLRRDANVPAAGVGAARRPVLRPDFAWEERIIGNVARKVWLGGRARGGHRHHACLTGLLCSR